MIAQCKQAVKEHPHETETRRFVREDKGRR